MENRVSLKAANGLYAVVIILLISIGSTIQALSPAWGLFATEIFIILLPALLFLLIKKIPIKQTLRLNKIDPKLILPIILIGTGLIFFVEWLASLISSLTGINPGVPPGLLPTNIVEAALIFFGMCILAPICEEILFRGLILRGYERFGVSTACLAVGFLFAGFHLSLLRLTALIPIALTLCWVVLRTDSIFSGILVHFFYNFPSTFILIISSLSPQTDLSTLFSPTVALVGFLIAGLGLLWFFKLTGKSAERVSTESVSTPVIPISAFIPLVPAVILILLTSGLEVVLSKSPQTLSMGQKIIFAPVKEPKTMRLVYEIQDAIKEDVGSMECRSGVAGENIHLYCSTHQKAFDVTMQNSRYISKAYDESLSVDWRAQDMHLVRFEDILTDGSGTFTTQAHVEQDHIEITTIDGNGNRTQMESPADAVILPELKWRLSGQPLSTGLIRNVSLVDPSGRGDETIKEKPDIKEGLINVMTAERLSTVLGPLTTWKVALGKQIGWYDVGQDHLLVKYDAGYAVFILKESQISD